MKKKKFQMIMPTEKKKIADPDALLRLLGKCDQRQFMIGMALREKQTVGMKE